MLPEVNKLIKKYRIEKGLTQEELGEKLNMKRSTFSQMENKGKIDIVTAHKIADALQINPDLLFYGEPDNTLTFTHIKSQKLYANSPLNLVEKIYGTPEKKNDPVIEDEFSKLEPIEKSFIKIYRNLSKSKQKEFRQYLDVIRKSR